MKNFKVLLTACALLLSGAAFTACSDDDKPKGDNGNWTLDVTPATWNFSYETATRTFNVTGLPEGVTFVATPSDTENFTISDQTANSFKATATANNASTPREETITVTAGGQTKTINITQAAFELYANVLPTSHTFPRAGGTETFNVTTNDSDWEVVSNPSWITPTKSNNTLSLKAAANSGDAREGNVVIKPANGTATSTIQVAQMGQTWYAGNYSATSTYGKQWKAAADFATSWNTTIAEMSEYEGYYIMPNFGNFVNRDPQKRDLFVTFVYELFDDETEGWRLGFPSGRIEENISPFQGTDDDGKKYYGYPTAAYDVDPNEGARPLEGVLMPGISQADGFITMKGQINGSDIGIGFIYYTESGAIDGWATDILMDVVWTKPGNRSANTAGSGVLAPLELKLPVVNMAAGERIPFSKKNITIVR